MRSTLQERKKRSYVLGSFKHMQFFQLVVPVAADAFKASGPVVEGMCRDIDRCLRQGHETPIEIDDRFIGSGLVVAAVCKRVSVVIFLLAIRSIALLDYI